MVLGKNPGDPSIILDRNYWYSGANARNASRNGSRAAFHDMNFCCGCHVCDAYSFFSSAGVPPMPWMCFDFDDFLPSLVIVPECMELPTGRSIRVRG